MCVCFVLFTTPNLIILRREPETMELTQQALAGTAYERISCVFGSCKRTAYVNYVCLIAPLVCANCIHTYNFMCVFVYPKIDFILIALSAVFAQHSVAIDWIHSPFDTERQHSLHN